MKIRWASLVAISIAGMLLCIPIAAYLLGRGSEGDRRNQVQHCTQVLHEIWVESLNDQQYTAAEERPRECRGLTEAQYFAAAIAATR